MPTYEPGARQAQHLKMLLLSVERTSKLLGIDNPYPLVVPAADPDLLTKEQAQACLPLVQAYIDQTQGPGWEPTLYPPEFHDKHWTIGLECQADNWPYYFGEDVYANKITLPPGVGTGALNHWCMTLYPVPAP